jgi:hypothetical protein
MKRLILVLMTFCVTGLSELPVLGQGPEKPQAKYEILFSWNHLDWLFPTNVDSSGYKGANGQEYWKGAMPAGFKADAKGTFYLSVPRWAPGIPSRCWTPFRAGP